MAAEVYIPQDRQGWWGGPDLRPRCAACHKVVFPSQAHAEYSAANARNRALERAPRADGKVMNAYLGKCGQWHVGHGKRRTNPQET